MSHDYRPHPRNHTALRLCACSPSTIRVLEEPLRRAVVRVLLEQTAISTTQLCSLITLAALSDLSDGDSELPDRVAIELHHVHLPKLASAGLVAFDDDQGVLSLRAHPDIADGLLDARLLASVDQAQWEAIASIHSHDCRRELLTVLAQAGGSLTLSSLATELAEATWTSSSVAERACPHEIAITLHHHHLPMLDGSGLVSYDASTHEVSYAGSEMFGLSALAAAVE
ncbi:hypothetical protein ACFQJC_15060 [Haloferax namakaokahaiae]|uniref:DUF7344 domain-containing protein n=1 Tax=Haloferax namakaokahaiae TaxID=1748331 RepID=A0ABD5ZHQ8_9EURY